MIVLQPTVCFDNWFPGSERCECERDASCQVELVLVSICVNVLAVAGLCQLSLVRSSTLGFFSVLHDKHRSKFTYDED